MLTIARRQRFYAAFVAVACVIAALAVAWRPPFAHRASHHRSPRAAAHDSGITRFAPSTHVATRPFPRLFVLEPIARWRVLGSRVHPTATTNASSVSVSGIPGKRPREPPAAL